MKSVFLRVFALGLLVSSSLPSWAQPNIAPPANPKAPTFKLNGANVDAIALISAFYTKMRRAESYRRRLIINKTLVKEGKTLSKKTLEIQSSWISDAKREGAFSKNFSNEVYTVTLNDKTTVEKFVTVDDGAKNYGFYEMKNVWIENNHIANNVASQLKLTRTVLSLRSGLFWYGGRTENRAQNCGWTRPTLGAKCAKQP